MVIVSDPLHSIEARGKLGGNQYNTHRGTKYVKTNSGPGVYLTAAQVAARLATTNAYTAWQALTEAQRQAWEDYGRSLQLPSWTGRRYRISGWNAYLRSNHMWTYMGGSTIDVPPNRAAPNLPDNLEYTTATATLSVQWTPYAGYPEYEIYCVFMARGVHPITVHPPKDLSVWRGLAPLDDGYTDVYVQSGPYTTFWLFTIDSITGLKSPWIKCGTFDCS